MIIGDDLARWLADTAAQRETQQAIEDFGRRWRDGPVHRRFQSAMDGLSRHDAESVTEAVVGLFSSDCWIEDLVSSLADELRSDPHFEPPFSALTTDIHKGLLVYEDPLVSVGVGISRADELAAKKNVDRGRVSIGFTGHVGILKFVAAGEAFLSFYEAPPITASFSAAEAGRCRRTGERAVRDGEILVCDGRYQSYVIERARSNLVVAQATVKVGQAPLAVEYDARTHEYVGCSAGRDASSRIQMVATLLRKLGHAEAFPTVAAFLGHEDFFVRWHVIRELMGIDAARALPHLEHMAAADPHPENRAAAAHLLARLPLLRKAA